MGSLLVQLHMHPYRYTLRNPNCLQQNSRTCLVTWEPLNEKRDEQNVIRQAAEQTTGTVRYGVWVVVRIILVHGPSRRFSFGISLSPVDTHLIHPSRPRFLATSFRSQHSNNSLHSVRLNLSPCVIAPLTTRNP